MINKKTVIGIIFFVALTSLSFGGTTYYDADGKVISESEYNKISKQRSNPSKKESSTGNVVLTPVYSNPVPEQNTYRKAFDIKGYYEKNKDYYGNASLDDVAKDVWSSTGMDQKHDFDSWKDKVGIKPIVNEDTYRRASMVDYKKSQFGTGINLGKATGKAITHTILGLIICGIIALVVALKNRKK